MGRRQELALVTLAGLVLAGLLSIRIAAPWTFVHDDNGAWTQVVATAHLRAGLARTHGQDFMLRRDGVLVPYLHHPPLYPLVVAAVYHVTGSSDPLITRLIPAAFHLLGFVGVWVLARIVFPQSPARRLIAVILYALVPMSSFFGKMPFNEPLGLCFVIWGTAALAALRARPHTRRRRATLAAGGLAWMLAGLTSWPAYPVLLGLWGLLVLESWHGGPRGSVILVALVALGTLGIVAAQLAWAGGLGPLVRAGGFWGAGAGDPGLLIDSLGGILKHQRLYFANAPSLLFAGWLVLAARDRWRGRDGTAPPDSARRFLLAGVAGCTLWMVPFARQVGIHGYGQIWLLPFETLAVADAAVRAWRSLAARPALRAGLAGVAAAVVLGSTAVTLVHRYTRPLAYAVETAAWLAETFENRP
jgi:hypothetical protein